MRNRLGLFLTVVATLIVLSLAGCGGGGGGGGGHPAAPADAAGISRTVNGFLGSVARKDSAAVEGFLAASYRNQGVNVLSTLEVLDFGPDPFDPRDNATYTFIIPEGGIYQGSPDYAEVYAYLDTPWGNRINLTFKLMKLDESWYISDFTLTTDYRGTLRMPGYFPLQAGDYWKYLEYQDGTELPYLTVHTVQGDPETIDGKQVFTLTETFEPRQSGSLPAPTGGTFARYGGKHRFSNTGGIWDFGPPAANGVYTFNGGAPLALTPEWAGVGSFTFQGTVLETFRGMSYSAAALARIGDVAEYNDRLGNFAAVPLIFSQEYANGQTSPFQASSTYLQRFWYLKDGLGIVAWFLDDRNTGRTPQEGWLVEARIGGRIIRPTEWPFAILTAAQLSDVAVGEPFKQTFTARWGTPPLTWRLLSGDLPPGLTLGNDGILSGTLSGAGTFRFRLQVSDKDNRTAAKDFTVTVKDGLAITTASVLPPARQGEPYALAFAGRHLTADCRWAVASGSSLPAGLSLDAQNGLLSGTPTTSGNSLFQVQVTDPVSKQKALRTFELAVRPPVAGALLVGRCLAFSGTKGIQFLLDFTDERGQPAQVAADSLASAVFSVTDRLAPKAGGSATVRTVEPSARAAQDGTVTLTFAADALDLRSTTLEVIASGVFSTDYTRVSTATVILPHNLGLFRQFLPWNELRADGGVAVPAQIAATGLTATELFLVYGDQVRSVPLTAISTGGQADLRVESAPFTAWSASRADNRFVAFVPVAGQDYGFALGGPAGAPFLAQLERGSSALRGWTLNASAAWVTVDDPRYLGIWKPGTASQAFLIGDAGHLFGYSFRSTNVLEQGSAFPMKPCGLVVGAGAAYAVEGTGSVRSFTYDPVVGFSGGQVAGTLPVQMLSYPTVVSPENGFSWRQVGSDLAFDVAEPAQHRLFQYNLQTGLATGRERGGDAALTGIRGRLNRPFGFVHLAPGGGSRQFTIVADADGLTVIEDRDASL